MASVRAVVDDLHAALNDAQHRAATCTEGPLLVLAGAGSGKTRVLVHRIAHIIHSGLAEPWQILSVTFTNKAAGEMRERLEAMLGPDIRRAWIGTFHSMCGRILRKDADKLGFTSNFTIYDSDDTKRTIKQVMKSLGLDGTSPGMTYGAVASEIDRAKNKGQSADEFSKRNDAFATPAFRAALKVYPAYQKALLSANAMDFGDMLSHAVTLLRRFPDVRERYTHRFRYVMVDEFQDTNSVQYDFLKQLVKGRNNLAVVGDDDQSIYRWRGADVRNILDFPRHYPSCEVVKLEQNYRSSANILDAANAVIRKNTTRHAKKLWTDADSGIPIGVALLPHSDDEAQLIARVIRERIDQGERADGFAILYRQNAQSRLFELAFRRDSVPFVLIGATAFFDRKEVKDILGYLRLVSNPASAADFERVINVPSRKIGAKTVEKLRLAGEPHGLSGARAILELSTEQLQAAGIKGKTLEKVQAFGRMIGELRDMADEEPAVDVANAIIKRTGYLKHLHHADAQSAEDRAENVGELVNSIAEFEAVAMYDPETDEEAFGLTGARTPLEAFLDQASLTASSDKRSEDGAVSMLTVHAAKGLEFPVVFMVGMEENTFPGKRAVNGDDDSMEEERRLCYVGITRAMQELNLTTVRFRRMYGEEEFRRPSRFLGDLPDAVVDNMAGTVPAGPGRTEIRGGHRIEYEDDPDDDLDDFVDGPCAIDVIEPPRVIRRRPNEAQPATGNGFAPGSRVFHNTFGPGVVAQVDGLGPRAYLTIDFPQVGSKRIVAKYVQPADERPRDQT